MNDAQVLPRSIERIVAGLESTEHLSPSSIVRIVENANVNPTDLEPWLHYDHPAYDGYGRRMIVRGDGYEVMAMSWSPGDFSAIHDHGYTMWGAIQIFGEAEHATFIENDGMLITQARWRTIKGDILPVTHELVHQMGNVHTEDFFVSLHVYGTEQPVDSVTGSARIFQPEYSAIQRVNGGVFFGLEEEEVVSMEVGPIGDFTTNLRNQAEALAQEMRGRGLDSQAFAQLRKQVYSLDHRESLVEELERLNDHKTLQVVNPREWLTLNLDFQALARLQSKIKSSERSGDHFGNYAPLYDAVVGELSLPFMTKYLAFFEESTNTKWHENSILSVGCGTGLVEDWLLAEYDLAKESLLGIDISASMVNEASRRIYTKEANLLDWDAGDDQWGIVMSGLNVYQYIPAAELEVAIAKTATLVKKGGYFVGDMITPDHIRWYPNYMVAKDKSVVSMRTPEIVEEDGYKYQESEIINISFKGSEMEVHYAGKHRRHLPTIEEVYQLFGKYFKRGVRLLDAVELTEVMPTDKTCLSTRYVVIAAM